jgi:hypothetical protein
VAGSCKHGDEPLSSGAHGITQFCFFKNDVVQSFYYETIIDNFAKLKGSFIFNLILFLLYLIKNI